MQYILELDVLQMETWSSRELLKSAKTGWHEKINYSILVYCCFIESVKLFFYDWAYVGFLRFEMKGKLKEKKWNMGFWSVLCTDGHQVVIEVYF